jgi:hypothetical protein
MLQVEERFGSYIESKTWFVKLCAFLRDLASLLFDDKHISPEALELKKRSAPAISASLPTLPTGCIFAEKSARSSVFS